MSDVKVSVIVPTYNQEGYIARTLDSILAQRCDFDFEIVLCDDCSKDATPQICEDYARRYPGIVRYAQNAANKGIVDNYFDAVRSARGIYIADCGGDDVWCDPLKLQKQADLLDANPRVALAHTDWKYMHEDTGTLTDSDPRGERGPWRQPLLPGERYFLPLLTRKPNMLIHSCAMMYRKEAFLRCDDPQFFSGRQWPCEDLQLLVALVQEGDVAYLPEVTMHYSVDKPSITSAEDPAKAYGFYMGLLKLTRALEKKYGVDGSLLADYYSRAWRYVFAQACKSGRHELISEAMEWRKANGVTVPMRTRMKMLLQALSRKKRPHQA